MKSKQLYQQAYAILNHTTPLSVDCGRLCENACCKSDGEEECGMYLYPGETAMFQGQTDNFKIEKSDFTWGTKSRNVPILFCKSPCNRHFRPLSCRIFPLVPYIEGGTLRIMMDPRGKRVCPLAKAMKTQDLLEQFVHKVEVIFRFFIKDLEMRAYIEEQSRLIDEWEL